MIGNKWFKKKKNVYLVALIAIFIESFSNVCLKLASGYATFSAKYVLWFMGAVMVMGIYAILWQLLLEHLPLTTAYLRKGISYILVYLWAFVFWKEHISLTQWIGTAIILAGMVVSQADSGREMRQ